MSPTHQRTKLLYIILPFLWYSSIYPTNITLPLASDEQLNLMVQHMADGSESKALGEHLNRVYISNHDVGLEQVWNRLQERIGSDEAVTQSLLNKLELFPQVSPHDHKTLQKFSNTIKEIEATKNDCSLPGLAALDISLFLKPIIMKLAPDLVDRLRMEAFKYKEPTIMSPFCRFRCSYLSFGAMQIFKMTSV